MIFRLVILFVAMAVAAAAAVTLVPSERAVASAFAAALVVALTRVAMDVWRLRRMQRLMHPERVSELAQWRFGPWGELGARVQRLLKERDERIRDSQARLAEFLVALETSPNGVILLDDHACIEWCNQTAAGHFGMDPMRDRQQYIGHLVRDPAFAAYLSSWNYSREVVLSMTTPGAAPHRISIQVHPYAGNRRLVLSRDVTAVEQAEAMRRDFVANVSHEIRTPLTVLSGFIETLQTLPLDAGERTRYLDLMGQQSQRMQTLVNDLLTLSRLEGSPPPGAGQWTPVAGLVQRCLADAQALSAMVSAKAPHQFTLGPMPQVEISGVPAEWQSAVSNLLSNAVRYTPAGGRISVEWVSLSDGRGELSVRDSGPGIAAEHLPRLTERFYRVDRSRSRETGGTGLGLAIVKHVLHRHGSELRIQSALGQGSTFTIQVPASRLRAVAMAQADAPTATGSTGG